MNPPKLRFLKGKSDTRYPHSELLSLWLLWCLTACNCRVFHQLGFNASTTHDSHRNLIKPKSVCQDGAGRIYPATPFHPWTKVTGFSGYFL